MIERAEPSLALVQKYNHRWKNNEELTGKQPLQGPNQEYKFATVSLPAAVDLVEGYMVTVQVRYLSNEWCKCARIYDFGSGLG